MWSRQEYFEQRNRRIVEQISERGELIVHSSPYPCRKKSSIFEGVIVYIDGHTSVPYTTLRQLVCDHGGRFEPVSFNVKLTHFVAENVSFAKYKDL